MIEIDIDGGKAWVYASKNKVSVSRIGDVILLTKDLKKNEFQVRSPWYSLFESDKIEIIGGTLLGKNNDILRLKVSNYNIENIVESFKDKDLNLAILQRNIQYKLCILNGEFSGYHINDKAIFDFNVLKSEMIYNR